jgi:chorismate mutase
METGMKLADSGKVSIIRAGVWKPRTRPDSFEGMGIAALPWLQQLQKKSGIPVCTEVASAQHVKYCLAHDIRILWIGARTTVNPFAVQEIAEEVAGTDVQIFVKNPIHADLALWRGAIERFLKVGIKHVGAIHRGFFNAGERVFRNRPHWQIAIDLKQLFPEIPMICDPSHMCGRRDMLQAVAQKSLDLQYDGLMIESHRTPDEAWSDAEQQITPAQLDQLISSLILRQYDPTDSAARNALDRMRKEMDILDDELLHILSTRMQLVREMGGYKKDNNLTILQPERWKQMQEKFQLKGKELNLSEEFLSRILRAVHDESINQQEKVFME